MPRPLPLTPLTLTLTPARRPRHARPASLPATPHTATDLLTDTPARPPLPADLLADPPAPPTDKPTAPPADVPNPVTTFIGGLTEQPTDYVPPLPPDSPPGLTPQWSWSYPRPTPQTRLRVIWDPTT